MGCYPALLIKCCSGQICIRRRIQTHLQLFLHHGLLAERIAHQGSGPRLAAVVAQLPLLNELNGTAIGLKPFHKRRRQPLRTNLKRAAVSRGQNCRQQLHLGLRPLQLDRTILQRIVAIGRPLHHGFQLIRIPRLGDVLIHLP